MTLHTFILQCLSLRDISQLMKTLNLLFQVNLQYAFAKKTVLHVILFLRLAILA